MNGMYAVHHHIEAGGPPHSLGGEECRVLVSGQGMGVSCMPDTPLRGAVFVWDTAKPHRYGCCMSFAHSAPNAGKVGLVDDIRRLV